MADLPPKMGQRAPFAIYLFSRGLGPRDVFKALGVSAEHVRRICLPYADDQWRAPSQKLKQKIASWTQGEIKLTDWEAPARRKAP